MKNALIIVFLIFSTIASATDYYISSAGNDTNNGLSSTTPWKTIAKVNSAFFIMKPGDRILFNRGNTFYGTIIVTKSGSAGNPITLGAYGTGAKPIITGFTTVSAWTNLGSNIWESTRAVSTLTTCNMVTINGVNTGMGRYPNTGYLTYQGHSGTTSIISNSLTSTSDWTGAELVLRKNQYIIDRSKITSQVEGTLTFEAGSNYLPTNGFGFFIQNDARTLDIQNEWYYNPLTKKIKVYSSSSPTNVQVATVDTLANMTSKNYITFDNISFTGSNKNALYFYLSTNITIQNCNFDFSGINTIEAYLSSYFDIVRSSFNNTNNNAITMTSGGYIPAPTDHILISEDTIRNTGTLAGMGKSIDEQNQYSAIFLVGSNNTIEKCVIDNTGYIPIWWGGESFLVKNNFITNYCFVKDDGGAIWTWNNGDSPITYTNQKVLNNIILNGIGALDGSISDKFSSASGIYCDNNSSNIEISGNTVANCNNNGILIHDAHEITVKNNTLYNNGFQITFYSDKMITHDADGVSLIRNIDVKENIFLSKSSGQKGLAAVIAFNDLSSFGSIDNNFYARPIDDDLTMEVINALPSYTDIIYSLSGWQTYSGFDAHSHRSGVTVIDTADIDFYYNASDVNKTITLNQPMIDVKGTKYSNSITLLPFASVVLMVDPNPTNQPPVVEISNPLKGNEYKMNSTITLEAIASDPNGSISKVEFYNGTVKLVELTSAPYTFTWKDVSAGTYSITAVATDNLNATTTSLPIEFSVGTTIKYDANSEIIKLYPNPNDGHFSIEFINPLQNERSEIIITDLAGKQVYNGLVSKEETIKQIDLSYIKSGIYILMLIYKEILITKKFIKY